MKPKKPHDMKTKLIQKIEKTELELIAKIGGSVDEMRSLMLDIGMQYLIEKYGYQKAKQMWIRPGFWAWWRIIWHLNNADVLDWLSFEADSTISWDDYAESQLAKALYKYKLTEREIKELSI
jgi:hypothetical protein